MGDDGGEELTGSERVLVVDDNAEALSAIRRTLEWHGYTVLSATDPEAAIELARDGEDPVDLLVTDVVMPGMTGVRLSRELLGFNPSMRVLYVSGYSPEEIANTEELPTATDFLQKPMTIRQLAERVRAILDRPA